MSAAPPLGFIGLGTMGEPMALNLLKSGQPLMVWNRSDAKRHILGEAGASVAESPAEVFAQCDSIILMLTDATATDAVLGRGSGAFEDRVRSRTIINMATVEPGYSKGLEVDIRAGGGRYVEAPVSGSRKPAEAAELVAMLAGEAEDVAAVRHLITPMCKSTVPCGPVPQALLMKLAVNLFLITMVTGLAEAMHFAKRQGLNVALFADILSVGPMASDVSRIKTAKMVDGDFARQASITDVLKNNRLVVEAAREAGIASPLLDACFALYGETQMLGLGDEDMIAVIRAIEHRTSAVL
ncbi:NAD(P)-dependent oxidoreductase [Acidisoma sp. S159]|uniref:NAD(P)-dependent oxidoreductase n=1 Tax=Acidisoma sp. S159 TaxID=1747225 RepID=UPI00131EA258|nr:NAD(P)-dependent oxidoreductase [Acidisoma sp. S159]